MLQTQVNYWALQETKRHNLQDEAIRRVGNELQAEQIKVNWFTAEENQRHNREQEGIGWYNAQENNRHNRATEDLGYKTLQETTRHNVQMEGIGWRNAAANVQQAQAATRNAMTAWGNYQLAVEMQPYKIQTEQSKDVLQEAQAAQDLANARLAGPRTLIDTGNMIGNLLGGAGKIMQAGKQPQVRTIYRVLD